MVVQGIRVDYSLNDQLNNESTMTVGDGGGAREPMLHEHGANNDKEPVPRCPLPTISELFDKLNDLEKWSVENCPSDALRHIRKSRSLLVSAIWKKYASEPYSSPLETRLGNYYH